MAIKIIYQKQGDCLIVANKKANILSGILYVRHEGREVTLPRAVWMKNFGKIPYKHVVRQKCGNQMCANPDHLKIELKSKTPEFKINEFGCHVCTSHKAGRHGYPQGRDRLNSSGVTEHLHRIIYKRVFGSIPPKNVVRHKCDNRMCINPEHLELGSIADNSLDMKNRNRQAKGHKIYKTKLNERKVREIRRMLNEGVYQKKIGEIMEVGQSAISSIKRKKTWSYVL